jgi:hypothetical protein
LVFVSYRWRFEQLARLIVGEMTGSSSSDRRRLATGLGILQMFVGIGAVPAGMAMISDPSGRSLGMDLEMLVNSPFADFLIPGVFLLLVNGIGSVLGAITSFRRHRYAGEIAAGLGTFLMVWIAAQVWWMGPHWLHVIYFVLGLVELILGLMFRRDPDQSG